MGGGLFKPNNKQVSPQPQRITPREANHRSSTSNGSAPPSPPLYRKRATNDQPEVSKENDANFLEHIAEIAMQQQRRNYNATTYGGLDLQYEEDSVDYPAQEASEVESESEDELEQEATDVDDGYYNTAEKALYEKPKPKPDKTRFEVSWKKGMLLGSGGFGKVYLGLDNDNGCMFAVKEISLGQDADQNNKELKSFMNEVDLMKNLRHENIVQYLGTMVDGINLYIFLEYVPGGSIAFILSKFGPFSEQLVKRYTRQILLGLEYLHAHRIMHRDIKGANILVDNGGVVKLADFGASKVDHLVNTNTGHQYQSLKGTPYWMAPEVIRQAGYGRQADIWSVGCTVIEMATGKPPFHEFTDQVSVLFHIASSNNPPPIPPKLSATAQDFLLKCFERNIHLRPNATSLLEHPFLREEGGRKSSGNSSVFSMKSTPRSEDSRAPMQFAKLATSNEESRPTVSPVQHRTPVVSPAPAPSFKPNQEMNPIEEPTIDDAWVEKRKMMLMDNHRFAGGGTDAPSISGTPNSLRRGDSMAGARHSTGDVGGDVEGNRRHKDVGGDGEGNRRHKRAISMTPDKIVPTPLPLDNDAPSPGYMSRRRHSALAATIRESSDDVSQATFTSAHGNGLCSSPSTPGRPDRPSGDDNLFSNYNMSSFNNSFNQSFNSINGTKFNADNFGNNMSHNLSSSTGSLTNQFIHSHSHSNHSHHHSHSHSNHLHHGHSNHSGHNNHPSTPKQKSSPKSPRKELDEDTIKSFLLTKSNDILASTRDMRNFTEVNKQRNHENKRKNLARSIDTSLTPSSASRPKPPPQISPKKFEGLINGIPDGAPTDVVFKGKKAPGTTTTTVQLNPNTLLSSSQGLTNPNASGSSGGGGGSGGGSGGSGILSSTPPVNISVNKSGNAVKNAW